jgi:hypothetical protein
MLIKISFFKKSKRRHCSCLVICKTTNQQPPLFYLAVFITNYMNTHRNKIKKIGFAETRFGGFATALALPLAFMFANYF